MQELVVESLVVSLAMVVFSVLVDETTQMPLAERDHACETLLFDRPAEPLGIGVEIGTLRRQPNRLNTGALQDLAKDPRIEGIAVVNQMARPAQTAIDRVGHIAGLLLHPRAARLRVDPGDGHAAGSQLDHEEDEVPPEPRQRQHLDGEQIAGRQALPVLLQERLPGHVPAPLGRRVDSVVVQDPLHRGPGDRVAEVRERAADPRVAPPRIVDRHPDHELGDVLSGHWSTSTSAGAAIVCLGDQSPVPTQDRIRGDDARDLRQDPPAEFVTAHSESTTLGVRQAKRPRAQVFSEDPILLPEIVDQIVLVTVHPASEREDEELQRRRHSLRLLGRLDQHRPSLGRFFAPYGVRRLMREHDLQAPPRAGHAHGPKAHDGTITTETPDVMWGTDMTATVTVAEGAACVFVAVDHCATACIGLHAAKRGTRFEALEPIRQGIRERFGGIGEGVARGLRLRHDHGSNYLADDFQQEVAFFGIESSPSFVREPEGNGVAERFIRTLKENLLWVRSFEMIEELRLALLEFKRTYNEQWMLEKYDYRSPAQVRRDLLGPGLKCRRISSHRSGSHSRNAGFCR